MCAQCGVRARKTTLVSRDSSMRAEVKKWHTTCAFVERRLSRTEAVAKGLHYIGMESFDENAALGR